MGIVRDLFDVFMEIRKMKDDKRKEYFDNVAVQTFEQLRAVNQDFLNIFAGCLEMLERPHNVQEIIMHLDKSRLRMQTVRQELYEKSRALHAVGYKGRDMILFIGAQENEDIREFLMACREYFETKDVYAHAISNAITSLERDLVLFLESGESELEKSCRSTKDLCILSSHREERILEVKVQFRQTLEVISGRWRRVARAFAEIHKHFV